MSASTTSEPTSATAEPADRSVPVDPAGTAPAQRRLLRLRAPLLMFAVVVVGAALPLVGNHIFYFWDDSAAVGVPVWHRIADAVLHGHFPLLNLDMWRGGNFAAEAATGLWNPVMVAAAIAIYPINNLAVGITLAKMFFMLVLAGGTYLLARDHDVRRSLSAVAGAALPLAGYSFFMDSTAWINALMLTAFTPWVWWAARRSLYRGGSLLWVVVTGYLVVSIGNPYGLLVVGFVVLTVVVEAWVTGRRGQVLGLLLAGVAVLLLSIMVYLPLLMTSSVGFRVASETSNNGFLKPSLTNLLELSSPSGQPFMVNFGTSAHIGYLTVPVVYLAWFVLPTLPWMRWRVLREQWRSHLGLYVFGGIYLLLMLGPSQIWMFRWPLRLIDFFWIPVMVLWVVLANQGFARTRWRLRATLSVAVVVIGGYLVWGERTDTLNRHVLGGLAVLVLVCLLARFGSTGRAGFAVLTVGTLLVLGMQVIWFPGNNNVLNYQFPTSVSAMQDRFAKYQGVTVQVASLRASAPGDLLPNRAYQDELFGSEFSVAGVESTTDYTGIGYTALDSPLCEDYTGSTNCPQAWTRLWQHPSGYPVPLADLLRAQNVVVQNRLVDTRNQPAPKGWHRSPADEASGLATVWQRDTPVAWPAGRLSYAPDGVRVLSDTMDGQVDEQLTYHRTDATTPAALTFARLAWPGYSATVNGAPATVRTGPDGLLNVALPTGVTDGQVLVSWSPPGSRESTVAFGLGALLTIGLGVVPWVRRRRRQQDTNEVDNATKEVSA